MDVRDIIDELARHRTVESMIGKISRSPMTADLKDLSQMVYEILLHAGHDRLQSLKESGHLNHYIARIIINQYRSKSSPYYGLFGRFRDKSVELRPDETNEEDDK